MEETRKACPSPDPKENVSSRKNDRSNFINQRTCTASPPCPICWRQKARTAVSCASPRYFVRSVAAALAAACFFCFLIKSEDRGEVEVEVSAKEKKQIDSSSLRAPGKHDPFIFKASLSAGAQKILMRLLSKIYLSQEGPGRPTIGGLTSKTSRRSTTPNSKSLLVLTLYFPSPTMS